MEAKLEVRFVKVTKKRAETLATLYNLPTLPLMGQIVLMSDNKNYQVVDVGWDLTDVESPVAIVQLMEVL